MITTTLERIRAYRTSEGMWRKLLEGLGKTKADDEPLPFARIVEINGLHDALWCCQAEPQYDREWRLFAVWCARQVQHLMTDPRSVAALDVAERYARGEATDKELSDARTDAFHFPAVYFTVYAALVRRRLHGGGFGLGLAGLGELRQRPAARAAQIKEFLRVVNETEART
jgi:hypothetical protein